MSGTQPIPSEPVRKRHLSSVYGIAPFVVTLITLLATRLRVIPTGASDFISIVILPVMVFSLVYAFYYYLLWSQHLRPLDCVQHAILMGVFAMTMSMLVFLMLAYPIGTIG